MKIKILAATLCCIPQIGFSDFEYTQWTNLAGNSFEAKLDHVEADKVILRAKKGGKRYPVKISTLSDDSKDLLLQYRTSVSDEIENAPLNSGGYRILKPALIYRAAALEMADALKEHRSLVYCKITNLRVTDRLTATIELEGGAFKRLQASKGIEFFIKEKTLNSRSSTKRNWSPYHYRYGGVNVHSKTLLQEGGQFSLYITPESLIEWDRVGVTDGPVIR